MTSRPRKKRRLGDLHAGSSGIERIPITNARDLERCLTDINGIGIWSIRDFLNRCFRGSEVQETEATVNRAYLATFLESQCRYVRPGQEGGIDTRVFAELFKIWNFASQNNLIDVLSVIPATLALLVRLLSHNDELKAYGSRIIEAVLKPDNMKHIYRGLTGSHDYVVSPCLRLLTEMNRFGFGELCGLVHSTFDFTIKQLPRHLEVKGSTKPGLETPEKPSLRTLWVRFLLSFMQHGEPSTRNDILRLRTYISHLFKHLKTDSPFIVRDLLDCMAKKVLAEKEIPKTTKTNVFNEWALGHILALYSRQEKVIVVGNGTEIEKTVSDLAHEFLLYACTTHGNGVCFPDNGWYPPGYSEGGGRRGSAPKVYNRVLSSFLSNTRPHADTQQLDLTLQIFKSCPELVADYFLSNQTFSFDPKLTSTWIGYCTFLMSIISLPIPSDFGTAKVPILLPPMDVMVENILPKPLSKTVITKWLAHENGLLRLFATRLSIAAFQKLREVLKALDVAASTIHNPTENLKCRFAVVEEFYKRIPDIAVVNNAISGKYGANVGVLESEGKMRLLANYYTTIPEMALATNFDINIALSGFLEGRNEDNDQKGMRLLEMGHLLKIAAEIPDVKWWNKSPIMKHSPFVAILKVCCNSTAGGPLQQVRGLLRSFASTSYLFQTETAPSTLDAFLESLSTVDDNGNLEAILNLLDEVVGRCIREPFKYLDSYAELALEVGNKALGGNKLPPVSPILMALVEQWNFFSQAKDVRLEHKIGGAKWLSRLLQSCGLLGENRYVIVALCDRLLVSSDQKTHHVFSTLIKHLESDQYLELASDKAEDGDMAGIRDLFTNSHALDIEITPLLLEGVRHRRIEVSLFDLAVVQQAIIRTVKSQKIDIYSGTSAIGILDQLMKYAAVHLVSQDDKASVERTKSFIVKEGFCEVFLNISGLATRLPLVVAASKGFAGTLSEVIDRDDPIFDGCSELLSNRLSEFVDLVQYLSDEDMKKVLWIYRSIIPVSKSINLLINRLCLKLARVQNKHTAQLFAVILYLSAEQGYTIDVRSINRLLGADIMTNEISSALVNYISTLGIDSLEGINAPDILVTEQIAAVVCALIPKLPSIRDRALNRLYEEVCSESTTVLMRSVRVSALLEAFSVARDDGKGFTWFPSTDQKTRDKLQKVFDSVRDMWLQSSLDGFRVIVFRRAASLFPSVNREQALKHIACERNRNNLTKDLVTLIEELIGDSDNASIPEMKEWFLMALDHLTRRFAEDTTLSDKVIDFAKALGEFLSRKPISLEKFVPRTAINAVLEAGLQKHIKVQEVVYFVVCVVSVTSPKSLDLAKLVQMVLGHPENPFHRRNPKDEVENIDLYLTFLILQLFEAGKSALCNIVTFDGLLEIYQGTNSLIDSTILDMIIYIEGQLARSCANRITLWAVVESSGSKPLISRDHGRLTATINGKMLATSVFCLSPNPILKPEQGSLDYFVGAAKSLDQSAGKSYDPRFLLPALTYCVLSESQILDAQTAIERYCVSFAIVCLSSDDEFVRQMATAFLTATATKLENSSYRGRTQVIHLILCLLASISFQAKESKNKPIPPVIGIFLAQAIQVLSNPTHFLYEKIMEILLHKPLLDLHDLPYILNIHRPHNDQAEEINSHKEASWTLNILTAGLKSPSDLIIYHHRNIFPNLLTQYLSPNCSKRSKEKITELLWNAASIEGGGTTLITRNGVISWIEQLLCSSNNEPSPPSSQENEELKLKRLAARIWEGSAKSHVKEWSRENLKNHFVGEMARLDYFYGLS